MHVFERICGLGVDPACASGREHGDHIAFPRAGSVEFRDSKVDALFYRSGRVEPHIDADRLDGSFPGEGRDLLDGRARPDEVTTFDSQRVPRDERVGTAAALWLAWLLDARLGAFVHNRERRVQRAHRRIQHEALNDANNDQRGERDANRHRDGPGREAIDLADDHAGKTSHETCDHEQDRRHQHGDHEDDAPLPSRRAVHAHQLANVFLPRAPEKEKQRQEHDRGAEKHPPGDPLHADTRLRPNDPAYRCRQGTTEPVADRRRDPTDRALQEHRPRKQRRRQGQTEEHQRSREPSEAQPPRKYPPQPVAHPPTRRPFLSTGRRSIFCTIAVLEHSRAASGFESSTGFGIGTRFRTVLR